MPTARDLGALAPARTLAPHTVLLASLPFNPVSGGPSASRYRSRRRGGPESPENASCVQRSSTEVGPGWNNWRGTQCTLLPRQKTGKRPPTSPKEGHGGPGGTPPTPPPPPLRRPATRRPRGRERMKPTPPQGRNHRRPMRTRGLAVQPTRHPSSQGSPPTPYGPPWGGGSPHLLAPAPPGDLAAPVDPAAMPLRDS